MEFLKANISANEPVLLVNRREGKSRHASNPKNQSEKFRENFLLQDINKTNTASFSSLSLGSQAHNSQYQYARPDQCRKNEDLGSLVLMDKLEVKSNLEVAGILGEAESLKSKRIEFPY